MKNQLIATPVIKEVLLNASVERVWTAITDKEEIKQWSFEIEEFRPEVGFKFTFLGEKDGTKFLHLCQVTEAQLNKKLAYTWTYDTHPDIITTVTITLEPEGNQTRLRLVHEGLENLPQDINFARENFVAGWEEIIGKLLKNHIEK